MDHDRRAATPEEARPETAEFGDASGVPRVIGIYMVGILPRDLGQSLAFYRALGVDLTQQGDRLHFASRARGGAVFFVNATGFIPASDTPRVALEFRLDGQRAVDEAFGMALRAGGKAYREPYLAPFGDYVGLVLDPDGNVVALSAPPAPDRPTSD